MVFVLNGRLGLRRGGRGGSRGSGLKSPFPIEAQCVRCRASSAGPFVGLLRAFIIVRAKDRRADRGNGGGPESPENDRGGASRVPPGCRSACASAGPCAALWRSVKPFVCAPPASRLVRAPLHLLVTLGAPPRGYGRLRGGDGGQGRALPLRRTGPPTSPL